MKNILIALGAVFIIFMIIRANLGVMDTVNDVDTADIRQNCREICGTVKKGETLFDIFKKYKLDAGELLKLKEASADIYKLKELFPGHDYKIVLDDNNAVNFFSYSIDDESILHMTRQDAGFLAEKKSVEYEKKMLHIGGTIKDNLVSSVGGGRENLMLALRLSDIFAWDIDFTSDLMENDEFKVIVEGLYLGGEFKKYGNILAAEFVNSGEVHRAYRFVNDGKSGYYDEDSRSLEKTLLKAPLNYRHISSKFSHSRLHPVLRIFRPHHGVDYAAPAGTPVSAVGDGKIVFSGHRGEYGKLLIIRHPNGWTTYYGHLSKFVKGIGKGKKIRQGQVIAYVGATGLATGPHLHYEMRIHNKPVNPFRVNIPHKQNLPANLSAEFQSYRDQMENSLAAITVPRLALAGKR